MRRFEYFNTYSQQWEEIAIEELSHGDRFRIIDDGVKLEVNGLSEWLVSGPAYKNEEGMWQVDYDYIIRPEVAAYEQS